MNNVDISIEKPFVNNLHIKMARIRKIFNDSRIRKTFWFGFLNFPQKILKYVVTIIILALYSELISSMFCVS